MIWVAFVSGGGEEYGRGAVNTMRTKISAEKSTFVRFGISCYSLLAVLPSMNQGGDDSGTRLEKNRDAKIGGKMSIFSRE